MAEIQTWPLKRQRLCCIMAIRPVNTHSTHTSQSSIGNVHSQIVTVTHSTECGGGSLHHSSNQASQEGEWRDHRVAVRQRFALTFGTRARFVCAGTACLANRLLSLLSTVLLYAAEGAIEEGGGEGHQRQSVSRMQDS